MQERRLEPRYSAEGLAELKITSGAELAVISVAVVDISSHGFQIELGVTISIGALVELRLRNSIVSGEIKNCRQVADGRYRAGGRSGKVLESPLADRHILDFSRDIYAPEGGYTNAGQQMVADHLGICAECRARIDEASRFLDEVRALRARA